MMLDEYQKSTLRTAGDDRLEILALGLAGEAGELADLIKKHCGHGHPLDVEKLLKELGDVMWYVARIADSQSVSLSDVAYKNIEKLKARYPDGFSKDASINRTSE
jgi:NTP pyrophosphatase (non-canonical NTP hydrolase)